MFLLLGAEPRAENLTISITPKVVFSMQTVVTFKVTVPEAVAAVCLHYELIEHGDTPYKNERVTLGRTSCRERDGRLLLLQYSHLFPGQYLAYAYAWNREELPRTQPIEFKVLGR